MRAVIQRARSASVSIDGTVVGRLERSGLVVLLGVTHSDGPVQIDWMSRKIADLRLLRDERSVREVGAPVLVVSQFTLYGEARKGRRPTWNAAAPGEIAQPVYDQVCDALAGEGIQVERGRFGTDMVVALENDGPFTLVLDSP